MQILLDCSGDLKSCCSDYGLASVLGIIKQFMELIQLVVPILLLVMATVNFIQLMASPDDKKKKKGVINKFLAAVFVFFIPVFVNIILGIMPLPYTVNACWDSAEVIKEELENKRLIYIKDEKAKEPEKILVEPGSYEKGVERSASNFKDFKHLDRYNQVGKYGNRKVCASGRGSTVMNSACGLSTYMAVRYVLTGKDTDFMDFCHEACRTGFYSGSSSSMRKTDTDFYNNKYGFKTKKMGNSYDEYIAELKKGNVVIPAIQCFKRTVEKGGFNSTTNGHYIALIQYDSKKDRIYVYNPTGANTGWTKPSKVKTYINDCAKYTRVAYK